MNSTIEQELERSGRIMQTTVGDSMEPMLYNRKSAVIIERLSRPLKRHDLPLYRRPSGQYVLHRILRVREHDYIIRGDNRLNKEIVPHEWIIGVATGFYRDGEMIPITDGKYRRYMVFLPFHTAVLRVKSLPRRIIRKCKGRCRREK